MEFKKFKLEELIKLKTQGVNTTTDKVEYVEHGIKIVQAKNIGEYYVTFDEKNFINEETYSRMKTNHILRKGDVLFTNIGSQLGNSAIYNSDERAIITWNVMKLIPDETIIYKEYLCYLLNFNRNKIKSLNSSSTMPFVSGKELMNLTLNVPNLEIQKRILMILKNLNKKIELNNQINNNLYGLGDAIYKKFILDKYDRTNKLSNLYKFQYGKGNNNPSNGGKYPVYGSNGIIGYYDEFNNEDAPVIGHIGANCGSLIFAYGKHYVTYNGIMCNIINRNYRYFGYETLRFLNIKREIRGSSQPFISYDLLNSFDIPLPQNTIIVNIENKLKTIYTSIKNNLDEINTLMQLRDTLLPKLMKGKIDLNEIEV